MATLNPTVPIHEPITGQAPGGGQPPVTDGGGHGNGGNDSSPDYLHRLRRARLGLIVAMVAVMMFFISFTSAMIVRKGVPSLNTRTGEMVLDWIAVNLPLRLLTFNTFLLLLSSVTMEFARRRAARQAALAPVRSIPGVSLGRELNLPWLGVTIVLGLGFLVGQWFAWQVLQDRGFYVSGNASSSFVYLLTASHAVHLFGGLVALLYAASARKKPLEAQRIIVDICAWYWHFMALLWIYIFALLAVVA
jgi:cytochrome c oxidase subunit III